ncbi:MAG: hypothetical protein KA003_20805 [Caldilineaceae bacterium]|nr:hypothetical protein [Caldilineaceae bacterium]
MPVAPLHPVTPPPAPTLHFVPILPLNKADVTLAQVGGKGMNLARLAQADFPVPDGFMITTFAYNTFVAQNHLDDHIRATLAGVIFDDAASLQAASVTIRARFAQGEMANELRRALTVSYRLLGSGPVAVRSSATAEDLPDMSFAGQQDTFLNVLGMDALAQAVIDCWSSLWTARAIGYRQRNAIDHNEVALAVIVQNMVQSQASGVLFTANPLTGTRTQTVIDATLGLGEALVSGQVEPDHYVVGRGRDRDRGGWGIVSKVLGAKALVIRGEAGGGVVTVHEDASAQQALPDDAILALSQLGQEIQNLFASPQDIEWAWADGELFILQSRPITSLFPVPNLPAGANPDELRVYFSFGAVQGMLDPMTPLGQDVIKGVFVGGGTLLGFHGYTPESQKVLFEAGERLWGHLTPMLNNQRGRKIYLGVIGAVEPGAASAIAKLIAEPGRLAEPGPLRPQTVIRLARFFLPLLGTAIGSMARPDHNRAVAQQIMADTIARLTAQAQTAQSMADQVQMVADAAHIAFTVMVPQMLPRIMAGMIGLRVLTVLAKGLTRIDPTITGQTAMDVTRGLPYNVTTEMDLALWTVAQIVQADPASAARMGQGAAPDLAADYLAGRLPYPAQAALAGFMDRYGMRGLAEIDFGRPRWREQPAQVMQMVQNYLRIDNPDMAPDAVFGRGAVAAQATIDRMAAAARRSGPLGFLKARLIRGMAARARALSGLRESPKFMIIQLFGLARKELLKMGASLVEAGVLAQAGDVVFLRLAELRELASTPRAQMDKTLWQALVAQRRHVYDRELARRQVPRIILSDGTVFFDGFDASQAGEEVEGVLWGSPVSAGVVEGTVHVVLDPYTAHLLPGEILVCPGTDPAWTPLFLTAGGLIMEVGGLMTHGSVVAREYGIPGVVGVRDATTRLVTGQRIRVDGSSGEIRVL